MNPVLTFLTLYGTALVPVVLALVWARHTRVERVRRFLRVSALVIAVFFFVIFAGAQVISVTCGGNILYGYTDCTVVSDGVANGFSQLTFYSILAGIIYVAVALILCIVLELRHRRAT